MLAGHAAIGHHITDRRGGGGWRREEGCGCGGGEVDEEVDGGAGSADDELCDLERGEGALESVGDTDVEGGECVVGVLFAVY